jgi:histidinol dehydrogenase
MWQVYRYEPGFPVEKLRAQQPPLPEVGLIFEAVAAEGDAALRRFTAQWDGAHIEGELSVPIPPLSQIPIAPSLAAAIETAYENIRAFHLLQKPVPYEVETMGGVRCGLRYVPLQRVGLYVPGGSAPLFSTVLMLGVPAQIAEVPEVYLCTPPQRDGSIHPAILYAAGLCGLERVWRCGGAQAIAAMALGTQSLPPVNKIFGPGNRYVEAAKLEAARRGIAIDMPAGPSEVVILADETSPAEWVAWDLLAQAEHGPDSLVGLITTHPPLISAVWEKISSSLATHPRASYIQQTLQHSWALLVPSLKDALTIANAIAPEHLILSLKDAETWLPEVQTAGSVFLGHWTPESAGDYASGTNHVLPTRGFARSFGSLTVSAFMRSFTYQVLSQTGIRTLAPTVITLAEAEGLPAHAKAIAVRYEALS